MTYIQIAIDTAVTGGYEHDYTSGPVKTEEARAIIFLDPLFWQCLIKTIGREGKERQNMRERIGLYMPAGYVIQTTSGEQTVEVTDNINVEYGDNSWQFYMLAFVRHLIFIGEPELFFIKLLK